MEETYRLPFQITMLGARGAGKTSMLAAMRYEFDRVCDGALQFNAASQTQIDLETKLAELKSSIGKSGDYEPATGVKPTDALTRYELQLYHPQSRAAMDVIFTDFPGEWLMDHRLETVNEALQNSPVILVAVDAPSLIYDDDGEHEKRNHPEGIANALGRAFQLDNTDFGHRLVMFIPIRGERWLCARPQNGEEIYDAFCGRFQTALKKLEPYRSRVGVVFCPIQTLGSIEFTHFKEGRPVFRNTGGDYAPVDCDQPLRYSLLFMLTILKSEFDRQRDAKDDTIRNRKLVERMLVWIWTNLGGTDLKKAELASWLVRSEQLRVAAYRYAIHCKQGWPVKVLNNPGFLTP